MGKAVNANGPRPVRTRRARETTRGARGPRSRRGASTLDYILVLAIIFPLAATLLTIVPRMVQLVYEFTVVQIGSPLM